MANPITLTLTVEQMNILASALSDLPYRVSAPLIADIQKQVAAQAKGDDESGE